MPHACTELAPARPAETAAVIEDPFPDPPGQCDIPACWDERLATVAHELRNPLATILLALQMIPGDRTASLPLAIAEHQARQAVRIIDDLFDVCAGSFSKLSVCPEVLDLAAAVEGAARAVEFLLAARRHRLTLSLPPEPTTVAADPLRLEQILTNLLTNAAKFTAPGGDIRLTAEAKAGQAVFRVRDNGRGIAPDQVSRVFDPFHQGAGPGDRSGGLGIGLTLVRALVELHGGSVEASSDGPGTGSEFVVRLPLGPRQRSGAVLSADHLPDPHRGLTRAEIVARTGIASPSGYPPDRRFAFTPTEVIVTERTTAREEPPRRQATSARIIRPLELVSHATASCGVSRFPAITHKLAGAECLWMGMTTLEPGTGTGRHRHGDNETGIYLVSGRIRLQWGERLESAAELVAGDIAFVPPRVPHEETNLSVGEAAVWVVVQSRQVFVPLKRDAAGTYRLHRIGR